MRHPKNISSASPRAGAFFLPASGGVSSREKAQVLDETGARPRAHPHRPRDRRAGRRRGGPRPGRHQDPRRDPRRADRRQDRGHRGHEARRWARSTSRSTATTSASRPSSRWCAAPRSPSRSRDAPWSSWTTCSSPAGRSGPRMDALMDLGRPARHPAGRAGRPRPSRAAHPPRLRRQEPAHEPPGNRGRACSASTTARTASSSRSRGGLTMALEAQGSARHAGPRRGRDRRRCSTPPSR